jgi:hypothetical protein
MASATKFSPFVVPAQPIPAVEHISQSLAQSRIPVVETDHANGDLPC